MIKLFHLVYVSDAAPGFTPAQLAPIARSSKRNNLKAGVTGLLLYGGGSFLQLLEGERAAVMATFDRVKGDPRHKRVQALLQGSTDRRLFSEWNMGVVNLDERSELDRQRLATLVLRIRLFAKGNGQSPAEAALELLRDFRTQLASSRDESSSDSGSVAA